MKYDPSTNIVTMTILEGLGVVTTIDAEPTEFRRIFNYVDMFLRQVENGAYGDEFIKRLN
jgi:hypothetical protein